MNLEQFRKLPLMGIARGIDPQIAEEFSETIILSGLSAIEVPMNSPDAGSVIKRIVRASNNRLMVGAGTVLTMDILREALDCGATFIVLPALICDVVEYCVKKSIPVFPGGLTPQEIHNAWNAGAAMVKVFPAKVFGPDYFLEIKAPFQDVELLACGGITPGNIKAYFSNGASAVAFGAGIFRKEYLKNRQFSKIQGDIEALISAFNEIARL